MNRRTALAALGSLCLPLRGSKRSEYLLISQSEIDAAEQKARRYDWAGAALKQLLARAETALASPLPIPGRGGQWGHWYSCKKDGTPLVTDSPTRHRCPKCGTVYTGEPYDSVVITRVHMKNSQAMRDMGLAFRFTGRREFADKTQVLLAGYAERYLSYPRHDINGKDTVSAARITSQTLDESTWLIPATWGYALVDDTLSESQRQKIRSGLLLPATDTIIGPSYENLANIQCWKNSAVGCVGFAIGDKRLISVALDNPIRGFHTLMAHHVMPGGLWSEGSLGYHHYALQALWPLAEATRRHGINLYANENYRAMFDAPVSLALPDATLPDFNDNPSGPLSTWARVYELAFARWKRAEYGEVAGFGPRNSVEALLYGADSLPGGDPIPKNSMVMREAGFAMLRSRSFSVAARFGKHGGGHGHPDMLDIITYADGKLFGFDPGSINYGVPLHREWYRSTIGHNTVSVDQTLQSKADGQFLAWSDAGGKTSLQAEAQVYPGVLFRRDLTLEGATLADRFTCESQAEHVYDWALHSYGTLQVSIDLQPRAEPLGSENGYQHLEEIRQGETGADWTATWTKQGASLTLSVKGEPGTTVFSGVAPGKIPTERIPFVLIRRRGLKTVFAVKHSIG